MDGNPNVIGLVASGSGGLVEFVENLKDDEVMYGYCEFAWKGDCLVNNVCLYFLIC